MSALPLEEIFHFTSAVHHRLKRSVKAAFAFVVVILIAKTSAVVNLRAAADAIAKTSAVENIRTANGGQAERPKGCGHGTVILIATIASSLVAVHWLPR